MSSTLGAEQDVFGKLFRKPADVEDTTLVEVLVGKIALVEGDDRVILEDTFKGSINAKLVAIGLGRHVLLRKGIIAEKQLAKPYDWFAEVAHEKPKTILESLSRLKKETSIFDREPEGYRIPPWAVKKAIQHLKSQVKSA